MATSAERNIYIFPGHDNKQPGVTLLTFFISYNGTLWKNLPLNFWVFLLSGVGVFSRTGAALLTRGTVSGGWRWQRQAGLAFSLLAVFTAMGTPIATAAQAPTCVR